LKEGSGNTVVDGKVENVSFIADLSPTAETSRSVTEQQNCKSRKDKRQTVVTFCHCGFRRSIFAVNEPTRPGKHRAVCSEPTNGKSVRQEGKIMRLDVCIKEKGLVG